MRHIHACMIVISIYLDISNDRKHIADGALMCTLCFTALSKY
jgi:hypothetical protein